MTDKSYIDYDTLADQALLEQIGDYIKTQRLRQNKTQEQVSKDAGISRSTLSLLERGETVTVLTLIQVLRVMDLLHFMDSFQTEQTISPLALAKLDRKKRKRARPKELKQTKSDW